MEELELRQLIEKTGIQTDGEMMSRLERYAAVLKEWNGRMNLTGITEKPEVYEKHFADSILPLRHVSLSGSLCDVGSGAGFPGMVLAIVMPSLSVTLMEPIGKRCMFLNEVKSQLGLTNVSVVNERAEDFVKTGRESFDFTIARAVAELAVLAELCLPLTKVGGKWIAMKGPSGTEEAERHEKAIRTLGGTVVRLFPDLLNGAERVQVVVEKGKPTPPQYPRSYAKIKKSPL